MKRIQILVTVDTEDPKWAVKETARVVNNNVQSSVHRTRVVEVRQRISERDLKEMSMQELSDLQVG